MMHRKIIRCGTTRFGLQNHDGFRNIPKPMKLICYVRTTKVFSTKSSRSSAKGDEHSYFSACLKWYSEKLDTHPITTKSISSGLVSGFGDLICQSLTQSVNSSDGSRRSFLTWETWDAARTGRFATIGTIWIGPVLHYWYGGLTRTFPNNTMVRVALDQIVFAPIFLTMFLTWLWKWEGDTLENIPSRLTESVPGIVAANWSLWVPAQGLNFKFVPANYQVLFSNFVALIWNAYLSYASHGKKEEGKPIKDENSFLRPFK